MGKDEIEKKIQQYYLNKIPQSIRKANTFYFKSLNNPLSSYNMLHDFTVSEHLS